MVEKKDEGDPVQAYVLLQALPARGCSDFQGKQVQGDVAMFGRRRRASRRNGQRRERERGRDVSLIFYTKMEKEAVDGGSCLVVWAVLLVDNYSSKLFVFLSAICRIVKYRRE